MADAANVVSAYRRTGVWDGVDLASPPIINIGNLYLSWLLNFLSINAFIQSLHNVKIMHIEQSGQPGICT